MRRVDRGHASLTESEAGREDFARVMKPTQREGAALSAQHTLSRIGWLAEQPADFRRRMAAIGRWRSFRAGEDLYSFGDAPEGVFGLEAGVLEVSMPITGDEIATFHHAQPGFWIGESALLAGEHRGVSLCARDDCLVFFLPAKALLRQLEEQPRDWAAFFKLSHRNTMISLKVAAELLRLPPHARVARTLLRLASKEGVVPGTQTEIGSMAGMSRAGFRRALAELVEQGLVETSYGELRLLDREALRRETDPD